MLPVPNLPALQMVGDPAVVVPAPLQCLWDEVSFGNRFSLKLLPTLSVVHAEIFVRDLD